MTDKQFYILWGEAQTDTNREAFVSDWSLSSMFETEIPVDLIEQIGQIWDVAHMSFKDIRAASGLSQVAFSEHFCVGRRTVENWEARDCCPTYTKLMMAELLGLIQR